MNAAHARRDNGAPDSRVRADLQLLESEQRYRRLFEQIDDAIMVHREGRILLANPVCHRVLGLDPNRDSLVGRNIFDYLHPDSRALARLRISALMGGEAADDVVEYRVVRADGSEFDIEVRSCLSSWDGQPAIQLVARDLTHRRQQEQQLRAIEAQMRQAQKMEAIGRLAGGIAHDFNNVLTAIGGFASLLHAEMNDDDPLAEYVNEIQDGIQRAASLTRQLLSFSKREPLRLAALDLNLVITNMRPLLERLLNTDVQLRTILEPNGAPVYGGVTQFEQVIMNLAVNARDAMPDGGVITIETRIVDLDAQYAAAHVDVEPGLYVLLSVSDTGCGIPGDVREQIFEPFFTTKPNGTGLGLSTTYSIVRQAGGNIWAYSELGSGTCFKIYIPAHVAQRPVGPRVDGAVTVEAGVNGNGSRAHATVLLVEDDVAVRELTERILRHAGYDVLVASDGPTALSMAASDALRFDLVLSDVVMPEIPGPALLARLRESRPHLRAVLMSGYAVDSVTRRADVPANTTIVEKPFSAASLISAVERVLTD